MKYGMKYLALAGSVALLAGCGGGGEDSAVNTFLEMDAEARAAAAGYIDPDTGGLLVSERTNLPQSGSADYSGYVKGEVDNAALVGELSLAVDFGVGDTGTISGSATNFQHETQGAYSGSLALNNGVIVPGASGSDSDGVAGDLMGTLSNGGNSYDTEIALEGGFLGGSGTDTPNAMAGGAIGTVGSELFDGIFILLQQP